MNTPIKRVALYISGTVQGVAYRANTCQEAKRLNLSGWVKNLPDGRVYMEAQGPLISLEALITWCRQGPPKAQVSHVELLWMEPLEEQGFFIR